MKKFLLIFAMLLLVPICAYSADKIVPEYVSLEYNNTFGLYQAPSELMIYKEPAEDSNLLYSISWIGSKIYPEGVNPKELFVV